MRLKMSITLYACYVLLALVIAANVVLPVYGGTNLININFWGVIDMIFSGIGVAGCAGFFLQPISKNGTKIEYTYMTPIIPQGIFRGLQLGCFFLFGGQLNIIFYVVLCGLDVVLVICELVDKSMYYYESEASSNGESE